MGRTVNPNLGLADFPILSYVCSMWNKILLAAVIGVFVGSAGTAAWMWPRESRFTTLSECVLSEMKGRQLDMRSWVVKACREREAAAFAALGEAVRPSGSSQ
jgi:hypothetical protein